MAFRIHAPPSECEAPCATRGQRRETRTQKRGIDVSTKKEKIMKLTGALSLVCIVAFALLAASTPAQDQTAAPLRLPMHVRTANDAANNSAATGTNAAEDPLQVKRSDGAIGDRSLQVHIHHRQRRYLDDLLHNGERKLRRI
jgi:hypothetical protein